MWKQVKNIPKALKLQLHPRQGIKEEISINLAEKLKEQETRMEQKESIWLTWKMAKWVEWR